MTNTGIHRLLLRQIKENFGGMDKVPAEFRNFIDSINSAYQEYDKDIEHVERILSQSSQELFKANKELKILNENNEAIIREKTSAIRKTAYNLDSAERISGLGIFTWSEKSEKLEISTYFSELCQVKESSLQNSLENLIHLFENADEIHYSVDACLNTDSKFRLESIRLKNDDRYFSLEGNVVRLEGTDDRLFIGVLRDVTATKLREQELDELLHSLEEYKNAIDNSGIVSITDEQGYITYVNQKFCSISQYTEKELLGSKHNIVNSGFHSKEFFVEMWKTISSGNVWKGEVRNRRKDGSFYWVDSTIVPFFKNDRVSQYISIRFDITEKKNIFERIEQQRNFYESILNNIPVDIAVFNDQHRYLFINPFAVKNEEIRQFLIGKDDFDYCKKFNKNIDSAKLRRELFNQALQSQSTIEFLDQNTNKAGKTVHTIRRFFPVKNLRGELEVMIGFGLDITEKIEQSNRLKESLEEKEALLGEVHHRVKNNLALVMGLIEMQNSRATDSYLRQQLTEIQNRISAMSLIHEKLYKSANFSKIDLQEYLHDFVCFLASFFDKSKHVHLHFDLDKVFATTKRAIPIALIVNELVTNCFKYAFKDKESGDITLSLKSNPEFVELVVADNGSGLPVGFDLTKTNSLGMKLLDIFTRQIKGKYAISSESGLRVSIRFNHEQESINS
jgi:PAS domain S-box-containing protein